MSLAGVEPETWIGQAVWAGILAWIVLELAWCWLDRD